MKKLSYLTIALALSVMVACKGKDKKEPEDEDMDDLTIEQVEPGASDQMTNSTEATEELTTEEELFGTDLEDSKAKM
ncbi:MAG: hypothetical protein H7Y00_14035 [Fimbriimonadaceae bacterium]|nr:hypothetical protein [Chitinophagales bacterium]